VPALIRQRASLAMLLPPSIGKQVPLSYGSGQRLAVKVTEADRVAWMRQFLGALEQWKTFLDSALETGTFASAAATVVPGVGLAGCGTTVGTAVSGCAGALTAVFPKGPGRPLCLAGHVGSGQAEASEGESGNLAVFAATAQAQQAQYLQQVQFLQQLQVHEAHRGASPSSSVPLRFKDSFRPMRICKHLVQMTVCRQGDQCTFAHNFEELHPSSPDMPKGELNATSALAELQAMPVSSSSASNLEAMPDLRLKKKKELCERFAKGYCTLGKVCSFAHGEEQLNTVGLAVCGKVKTQVCRNWQAGRCIYGNLCNNAHGEHEIGTKRPPPELAPPMKRRHVEEEEKQGDSAWGNFGSGEGKLAFQPETVPPAPPMTVLPPG